MKKIPRVILPFLLIAHVVLAYCMSTGRSGFFYRDREPAMYWIDIILSAIGLLTMDVFVVRDFISARRRKEPNKAPELTPPDGAAHL